MVGTLAGGTVGHKTDCKQEENDGMKRAGKNFLENALPDIRKRVSALPETARYESFGIVYAQVLFLRDKFDEIARELYAIENQEEICFEDSSSKNSDRMRT